MSKIKVSTSTNICNHILWNVEHYSSEQGIRCRISSGSNGICKKAGVSRTASGVEHYFLHVWDLGVIEEIKF